MKATTTLLLCCAMLATGCVGWQRVGQMTMLSTRNVDSSKDYQPLMRGVEAEAAMKHDDAMQLAVERAVAMHPGGEYMMNVSVYVKENGKAVKVKGDVWGTGVAEGVATGIQTGGVTLKVGDRVAWQTGARMTSGTIVGMRPNSAVVEYERGGIKPTGQKAMKEVPLTSLTKVE